MDIEELNNPLNIKSLMEWMGTHGVKDTACAYLFLTLAMRGSKSYEDFSYYSGENLRKVKTVMGSLRDCGLIEVTHGLGNIAYVHVDWEKVEECFGREMDNRVKEAEFIGGQVEKREERRRQVAENKSDTVKYLDKCLEAYEDVFGKPLERNSYCVGALLKLKDKCIDVCKREGVTVKEWATLKWRCIKEEGTKEGRVEDKDYNRFLRTRDHVKELEEELRKRERNIEEKKCIEKKEYSIFDV